MYYEYTEEQLRAFCRTSIETFEIWARRFIHEILIAKYGQNYLYAQLPSGVYIVGKYVSKQVERMIQKDPARFPRKIDTLFVENIVDVLCNDKLYKEDFKDILLTQYPQGKEEVRTFLTRIADIRNYLSHANPISIRQAEQAVCYSHDFIDCIKQYYKNRGEEQMWNVPKIIKVKDSLGNVFDNIVENLSVGASVVIPQTLQCGERYTVEIEIDTSFKFDEYAIVWRMGRKNTAEFEGKTKFTVDLTPQVVGQTTIISCTVIQKKEWHKFGNHDSCVNIHLTVLPPIG